MNRWLAFSPRSRLTRTNGQKVEARDMSHAPPIATTTGQFEFDVDRLIGTLLVAVLPAVFWSGMAVLVCASFGVTLSWFGVVVIGASVAGFLGFIFRAIRSNRGS